jgi:hypothetical protein
VPSVTEKEIRELNIYIPVDTSKAADSLRAAQAAKLRDTTKLK